MIWGTNIRIEVAPSNGLVPVTTDCWPCRGPFARPGKQNMLKTMHQWPCKGPSARPGKQNIPKCHAPPHQYMYIFKLGPNLFKESAPQKLSESVAPIYVKKSSQNTYIGSTLCDICIFKYIGSQNCHNYGTSLFKFLSKSHKKIAFATHFTYRVKKLISPHPGPSKFVAVGLEEL